MVVSNSYVIWIFYLEEVAQHKCALLSLRVAAHLLLLTPPLFVLAICRSPQITVEHAA
jgi:hypothetical protein